MANDLLLQKRPATRAATYPSDGGRGGRARGPQNAEAASWLAWFQVMLLAADLALALAAETPSRAGGASLVLALYMAQLALVLVNGIILWVRFMSTILFRSRLLALVLYEFRRTLLVWAAYLVATIVSRIVGYSALSTCTAALAPCDGMTGAFIALYIIYRLVAIAYYILFYRGLVQLGDLKYYRDTAWLRQQLSGRR